MSSKIVLKCYGLDENGLGLVKYGKNTITVSNILPKEEALIEINNDYKYNKYKVLKITKPSSIREKVNCSIYNRCGGCQLLHLMYEKQMDFKKEYVIKCLKNEKLDYKMIEEFPAKTRFAYRNKMQVAYKYKDNKIIYGFYEEDTHQVIPLENCLVQTARQNEIVKQIANIMKELRLQPYNEDKRTGLIRFAVIREAFVTKELLLTIVTNSDVFPGKNEFIKRLLAKCPYITSIVQNINNRKTSIILGDEEKILYGKGYIEDELCKMRFKVSSKSFYQVNHEQTEILYNKVLEYADLHNEETVLDAYCGVGTIGLILSPYAKRVIGVELNKQSVACARDNMLLNKSKNIQFICNDATEYIDSLANNNISSVDVLIMDPPRSGSTPTFLKAAMKLNPKTIIYVSCEANTLARDLKLLVDKYEINKKAIVDMFVGTYHIETIVQLIKK